MPEDTTTIMPEDTTINTGINHQLIEEIKIYPNPSKDQINIDYHNEIKEVSIFNLNGKQLLKSDSKVVNVSSLQNGLYFIVINDKNNKIIKKKLIINK